ncbi:cell division topological specificity factor MinE [Salipiger sp.]|uniref:cell division topological specificity factor MinE n=1 Tax=Salipiger sp. TaxID=2078585 RepID=UPI003A96F2C0
MSLFGFSLKPRRARTASTAKDRLQLLLAHERAAGGGAADFLPMLQKDLLEVIRKYVTVADEDVDIRVQRDDAVSSLEINIEMPSTPERRRGG